MPSKNIAKNMSSNRHYINLKDLEFDKQNMKSYIENLNKEMLEYASNLKFEEAAKIRDKIKKIKSSDLGLITNQRIKKK